MSDTATLPFHGTVVAAGFAPTVVQSSNVRAPTTATVVCAGFAPTVIEATYWTEASAAATTWNPVEF